MLWNYPIHRNDEMFTPISCRYLRPFAVGDIHFRGGLRPDVGRFARPAKERRAAFDRAQKTFVVEQTAQRYFPQGSTGTKQFRQC